MSARRPNIVFIFADEWRAQASGYAGDTNCITPCLDALAGESLNVTRAVSGHPVCCPYRASLMTGQYPLTHGVFINDVELDPRRAALAPSFARAGYRTAYIGKWHLYGSPEGRCERRHHPVPRSHQLGFDDWWGYECCHDYWHSPYYHNDDPTRYLWDGYDLFAQAGHAARYIRDRAGDSEPYFLMLSWGPPHFPLQTAPEAYRALYADREIALRPNVPPERRDRAVEDLRGYYAHIAALDQGLRTVLEAIEQSGTKERTLLVVTSDHGEMAQSQGLDTKFVPFEESLRVPMLIRWPDGLGRRPGECPAPLDAPDILPTLLGMIGERAPETVEGRDWSPQLFGREPVQEDDAAFLQFPAPYTEMQYYGLPAYRGIRTKDVTYVENPGGPWLLFDNEADPFQMRNLVGHRDARPLLDRMRGLLKERLAKQGDEVPPARATLEQAGLAHYAEANWRCGEKWHYRWE